MSCVGIYGGSFNPPHAGHVLAAQEAVKNLGLDRLLVIPAFQAPHKQALAGSPTAPQRLRLTQLAFSGIPEAEVSDIEILREGVSFTVDTLRTLKQQLPGDELVLLMGTDMLLSFTTWRAPEEIARLATLAVMRRQEEPEKLKREVQAAAADIEAAYGCKVLFAENRSIEVSSTELRRMLAFHVPDTRLPAAVLDEIRREGLYGFDTERGGLPFDALAELSISLHDEKRRAHVQGCCDTARELAKRWGADEAAAERAGILHDITKALSPEAQLAVCDHYGEKLTLFERSHPKLLHAKSGAAVAERVFRESPAVCEAIRWHTTGKPQMRLLEKIIYLADYMEPNRDFPGVEHLRALSCKDLDAALLLGLEMSLEILRRRGQPIDENSMAAWQYLANERSNTHDDGTQI